MGIGSLDSQKGEKSKFWKLESNGPMCSHQQGGGRCVCLEESWFYIPALVLD